MKKILLAMAIAFIVTACNNSGAGSDNSDTGGLNNGITDDTSNPMNNTITNPQNDIQTPSADTGMRRDSVN
jgi:predicted small secreted protein